MIGTHEQVPIGPHGAPAEFRQNRLVQHPDDWVHDWPTDAHVDGWQVPFICPAGITQPVPVQQSALELHVAPCGWQTRPGPHMPLVQTIEQHCADVVQVAAFARQVPASVGVPPSPPPSINRQAPPEHWNGAQQPPAPPSSAHVLPAGVHDETTHCTPPSAPGTHAAPLQH